MSEFIDGTLNGALGELRGRRAKLEAFIREAGELDVAIREMEKVCRKVGVTADARPRPVAAVPAAAPATSARPGSNAERALAALQAHPRGLSTSVVMREADIASGSVSVVLRDLVDKGRAVKVGRGFWRAVDVAATG